MLQSPISKATLSLPKIHKAAHSPPLSSISSPHFPLHPNSGKYASGEASSACSVCGPGTYQDTASQSSCKSCTTGKYNKYAATNANNHDELRDCVSCELGKYQPGEGKDDCIYCDPGTYVATTGSDLKSDCVNCDVGKYRVANSASACTNCPNGRYNNNVGATCLDQESSSCTNGCIKCQAVSCFFDFGFPLLLHTAVSPF